MKGKDGKKDGKHMKEMHHASKQHMGKEAHKKGGMVKAKKKAKHVGKVDGMKGKERMDRKKRGGDLPAHGYKSGGKISSGMDGMDTKWPEAGGSSTMKPMSAAAKTEKDVEGEKEAANMKKGGRLTAAKRKK